QSPCDRLAGCSFWPLRFAVYSNGDNLNRRSSSWLWVGICVFHFRTATWRNCWPSGACTPITSRCGDGSSVTRRKSIGACGRDSTQPTTVGAWTRLTSGSRASGCIYTGLWIRAVRRSTSSSRPKAMQRAAERFLTKALGGENHPAPRVINTDKGAAYPPAIVQLKSEAALE